LLSRTAIVGDETNLVKFWDNAGTITALGSTTVVGHRLYRFSNGQFAMQYGQGNYANITLARAGVLLEDYELNPRLLNATFFGWWLLQETATNTGGTTLTDFREYTIGVQGGSSSSLAGCLLQGNNLSDLLDADAARDNLELGDFPTTLGTAGQVLTVNAGATAAEWAAATAGTQGETGETGLTGAAGNDGADSTVAGPAGADGAAGSQGIQGIQGETGATGPAGADGSGGSGGSGATLTKYNFTATAGQTSFSGSDDNSATLAYTAASLIVTLNGVMLEDGIDYTATNGTAVILSVAASLDDELNVVAFGSGSSGGGDSLGTVTANDVDLSTGNFFEITANDQTLTFSNAPAVHDFKFKLTGANITSGFDISAASYDSVSLSVSGQDADPYDISFNDDGTKMYLLGDGGNSIYQYSLSTGFDLSTASYDSVSFSVSSQETSPQSLTFNTSGTKMYVIGLSNDTVYQYSLSTAFDLSTASYSSVSFDAGTQATSPRSLRFNDTGSKLFILDNSNDTIHEYDLSSVFDVSTSSYNSVSFAVGSQDSNPQSISFNNSGQKMYLLGEANDTVYQYSLSTEFDLSTASYDSVSFSVGSQAGTPIGFVFNGTGTKMYVLGLIDKVVYQFSTVGPSAATITYPSSVKFPNATPPTTPSNGEVDIVSLCTIDEGISYDLYSVSDNQS
jgi:hypothetical protein